MTCTPSNTEIERIEKKTQVFVVRDGFNDERPRVAAISIREIPRGSGATFISGVGGTLTGTDGWGWSSRQQTVMLYVRK